MFYRFKNLAKIATTSPRRLAIRLLTSGLTAVRPDVLLNQAIDYDPQAKILQIGKKIFKLDSGGRIFVIGGGKSAGLMAQETEAIIGAANITAGVVNCQAGNWQTKKIKVIFAGHPWPNEQGVRGVEQMLALKEKYQINEKDLIICLLSGGASALMPYPAQSISLRAKQKITRLLLGSGANIQEINIVRKHLSQIKGGQLAKKFFPAQIVSLLISDVPDNDLSAIASGPTVTDKTTFFDAYQVLRKYNLWSTVPLVAQKYITAGIKGKIKDTPKRLGNVYNFIIGDNKTALQAMARQARKLGLRPYVVSEPVQGAGKKFVSQMVSDIKRGKFSRYNVVLAGGEITFCLPPKPGRGGRNQHLAALFALAMHSFNYPWAFASLNTDGFDYLRYAAGAIVDNKTLALAQAKNINFKDYVKAFDSFSLFKKLGRNLLVTGPTGVNVADLIVFAF